MVYVAFGGNHLHLLEIPTSLIDWYPNRIVRWNFINERKLEEVKPLKLMKRNSSILILNLILTQIWRRND